MSSFLVRYGCLNSLRNVYVFVNFSDPLSRAVTILSLHVLPLVFDRRIIEIIL